MVKVRIFSKLGYEPGAAGWIEPTWPLGSAPPPYIIFTKSPYFLFRPRALISFYGTSFTSHFNNRCTYYQQTSHAWLNDSKITKINRVVCNKDFMLIKPCRHRDLNPWPFDSIASLVQLPSSRFLAATLWFNHVWVLSISTTPQGPPSSRHSLSNFLLSSQDSSVFHSETSNDWCTQNIFLSLER